MEILILIIREIIRALQPPQTRPTTNSDPDELTRRIQARIEAARVQEAQSAKPVPSRIDSRMVQIPGSVKAKAGAYRTGKMKRKGPPAAPKSVAKAAAIKAVIPPAVPPAASSTTPPPPRPAVKVDAAVLTRWLRPQTLRSQFILTEIFQPPISLRPSHLDY